MVGSEIFWIGRWMRGALDTARCQTRPRDHWAECAHRLHVALLCSLCLVHVSANHGQPWVRMEPCVPYLKQLCTGLVPLSRFKCVDGDPLPPPCASTRKVRKTTVTPGPGAQTRRCLRKGGGGVWKKETLIHPFGCGQNRPSGQPGPQKGHCCFHLICCVSLSTQRACAHKCTDVCVQTTSGCRILSSACGQSWFDSNTPSPPPTGPKFSTVRATVRVDCFW